MGTQLGAHRWSAGEMPAAALIDAVKRKGPYGRSWHLITSQDSEKRQEAMSYE